VDSSNLYRIFSPFDTSLWLAGACFLIAISVSINLIELFTPYAAAIRIPGLATADAPLLTPPRLNRACQEHRPWAARVVQIEPALSGPAGEEARARTPTRDLTSGWVEIEPTSAAAAASMSLAWQRGVNRD
jgi:hypothetical protein